MKKVLLGLLVVTVLGMILAACNNPSLSGSDAALARAVALNDADKLAAASVKPSVSARTNASGKDISSNAQGTAVPGMYFFWDPKQKDNGYLKVSPSVFDDYASFVLTTKEANKYWDFLIAPKFGQPLSADGFYVFFIPKQEKNINGVWICDYAAKALVAQKLDFTEFVGDVPNPDRGFERGNDDGAGLGYTTSINGSSARFSYMTVPVDASTILGQPFELAYEMTPPYYFGGAGRDLSYCNVPCEPRIVQFYLVINNYSSNAWCQSQEGLPSAHTRVGVDGPITDYGLNYIRQQLQFIRDNTNSVAHIRPCYDPKGWNQVVWSADNLLFEDGSTSNNSYTVGDRTKPVDPANLAAQISKPGAGTWRGSSPVFRMCTVPGYTDLNWVQYHYLQLKPIFEEFADIIWAFDSGTYGPWGETHSCYEAEVPGNYKMLLDSLLNTVPDGKPIMTHVGAFLDWYNRTYNTTYDFGTLDTFPDIIRGTPEARFGFFSDSTGFSEDEWAFGNDGSWTEGYRMLAHDPILPGYDPDAVDPSHVRTLSGNRVNSVVGYNTTGTNRLVAIEDITSTVVGANWRGVAFIDWDRTKQVNFLAKMSVYGGETAGNEPTGAAAGVNGTGLIPLANWGTARENEIIQRYPSLLYENSVSRQTYWCIQQEHGSWKSRADYVYNRANIDITLIYPWNGLEVKVLYDPLYEGQSTLAYNRDRMGFRLVMREAKAAEWVPQGGTLKFEGKIQNVGWGVIFNRKAVKVILKSASGAVSNAVLVNIDPYDWQPAPEGPNGEMPNSLATNTSAWRDFGFNVPLSAFGSLPAGEYGIYLKINDPKERSVYKRSIRFANNGNSWDESIGANLIGKTIVY